MTEADRVWHERGLRSAVLAGDEQAWRRLYDDTFPTVYAYVVWRCGGLRALAEDVMQDTWLIAVRRIRRFDPAAGSFASWVRGIAANVLRNQLRIYKNRCRVRLAATEPQAQARTATTNEANALRLALAQLSERHEAVLRAKYLDQQSVMEISDSWKESPKAIESLLTRARQAFREAYTEEE